MKFLCTLTCAFLISGVAGAQTFSWDLRDYHGVDGLKVDVGLGRCRLSCDKSVSYRLSAEGVEIVRARMRVAEAGSSP